MATRHLSTCRGTYASPRTNAPLCHASPSFAVSIPGPCRSCSYASFCNDWEDRIAEAEARHSAARQLLNEFEDDWSCAESSADDSWGAEAHSTTAYEGGAGGYGADSPSDIFGFGDAETAQRERTRAEADIERLRTQFYKEQWGGWRPMVAGPSDATVARRRNRQRRCSASKMCGDSPLKSVALSMDDEYEEDAIEDGILRRADSDTPSDESRSTNSDEADERDGESRLTAFSWEPVMQRHRFGGAGSGLGSSNANYTPNWSVEEEEDDESKSSWVLSSSSLSSSRSRSNVNTPLSSLLSAQTDDDDLLPDYGMA